MDTNQIRRLCGSRFNNVFLDCVAIDDLKDEELLSELCDRSQYQTIRPQYGWSVISIFKSIVLNVSLLSRSSRAAVDPTMQDVINP